MSFHLDNTLFFTAHISDRSSVCLEGVTQTTASSSVVVVPSVNGKESVAAVSTLPLDLELWHHRTMHHHIGGLKRAIRDKLVNGIQITSSAKPDPICEPCLAGKMHADPFPTTNTVTPGILDLVHSDLVTMPVKSSSGYLYWIGFHDDASSFHAAYPLKKKSEAFATFKGFKVWAENLTGHKIKALQEDKGGEYMSNEFDAFCLEHGIERHHSTCNWPQQNGSAERANCTIMNAISLALAESGLPHSFWAEALGSFVHVWNRLPSMSTALKVKDTTPYQMWYKKKPDSAGVVVLVFTFKRTSTRNWIGI